MLQLKDNVTRFLIAGVLLGAVGCGGGDVMIHCGETRITIDEVLAEVDKRAYDGLRDDPRAAVEAAVRNLVVRTAILSEPPEKNERAVLEQAAHERAARECVDVEIKRSLAGKADLDAEARARFEADPSAYTLPESFRLQLIFIPEDEPGGEELAERVLSEVVADPGRFAELAGRYSRSETAAAGGRTKPMPGSRVHPEMRRAIGAHRNSESPFLIHIDRGWYVIRVLEYWPAPEAAYDQVAQRLRDEVGRQLVEESWQEISAVVEAEHRVVVSNDLIRMPVVTADAPVYTIDENEITVSHLLPGVALGDTVPGPVVGRAVARFRRWYEPAVYYGCLEKSVGEVPDELVLAHRMRTTLVRFAAEHMVDAVDSYVAIHRQALFRARVFIFDLWTLPFHSGDPYRDLEGYGDLIASLRRAEAVDNGVLAEAGVGTYPGTTLSEPQLRLYEPALVDVLELLGPGETSEVVRSMRLGAFILVRLIEVSEAVPLSLEEPGDRRVIISRFVADAHEEVLDAFFENAVSRCHIDQRQIKRCEAVLSEGPGSGMSQ